MRCRKTIICILICILQPITSVAAQLDPFGSVVFRLQKKTALRGNAMAQYKLGTFYEFGMSVKADLDQAIKWYEKSALKNYKPAIARLTFHEIKKKRYIAAKHAKWFENVNREAKFNDPHALILLGQMYQYGVVVNKNLSKAAGFLSKASALGHSEVDGVINKIRAVNNKNKIVKRAAPKKLAAKKSPPKESVSTARVEKTNPKVVADSVQIDAEKEEQDRKWKRYEKAMQEYYRQQLILQQQQEWSESVDESE